MNSKRRNSGAKQGAQRNRQAKSRRAIEWSKVKRWGQAVVLGSVLGAGGFLFIHWFEKWLDKPVVSVAINGEFNRVSREQAAHWVNQEIDGSFMRLDLERLQASLQERPWIDYARVERRWPDRLEVTLVEHKPIARWGKGDALNHRGGVVNLDDGSADRALLQELPQLNGERGAERELMNQYQSLSRLLTEHGLVVRELRHDQKGYVLVLKDGVEILLGDDDLSEKVNRFLAVYTQRLKTRWAEVASADVRYSNGVAVNWNNNLASRGEINGKL